MTGRPVVASFSRIVRMLAVSCAVALVAIALAACGGLGGGADGSNSSNSSNVDSSKQQEFKPEGKDASATIRIASGSENREAAEAIQQAVNDSGVAVQIDYMGSLDIQAELEDGAKDYDAVWPASSIWISLGDKKHLVKDEQSTSTTPVVFGIKKSRAVELGWASEDGSTKPVSTKDVADAVAAGKLSFSMTSATQSNSGASAYLAFLSALKGTDTALTAADLKDATLQNQVKSLLSGVNRSSGSSDWLKDMIVANPDKFDAMVNYESLVIAANKQLTKAGKEPLVAVYPTDGIAVSDSPLGYVDRCQGGDTEKAFKSFQKALASKQAKLLLERAGRRTGLGGVLANASDSKVKDAFRAEWGIRTEASALKAVPMPTADVITSALNLYQTGLRKPSWTVWVVDYSGSMIGEGKKGVTAGLKAALDPKESRRSMIQPGPDDVNIFIPFSSSAEGVTKVTGDDTKSLLKEAEDKEATGGTNIYDGLNSALQNLPSGADADRYTVAIVLMTDGVSDTAAREQFTSAYDADGRGVPVYSIMFGEADPEQLNGLAKLTDAKVFDGRTGNLADVFRQVKGYN